MPHDCSEFDGGCSMLTNQGTEVLFKVRLWLWCLKCLIKASKFRQHLFLFWVLILATAPFLKQAIVHVSIDTSQHDLPDEPHYSWGSQGSRMLDLCWYHSRYWSCSCLRCISRPCLFFYSFPPFLIISFFLQPWIWYSDCSHSIMSYLILTIWSNHIFSSLPSLLLQSYYFHPLLPLPHPP